MSWMNWPKCAKRLKEPVSRIQRKEKHMIRLKTYDKTERIRPDSYRWLITEKLNGSNLCIGMTACGSGTLLIHQRKKSVTIDEADRLDYPGLKTWVREHEDVLRRIYPGSVLCGEWLGMGKLRYPESEFPNRFNVFAKARYISEHGPEINPETLNYDPDTFGYVLGMECGAALPDCMSSVPVVQVLPEPPSIERLNLIYSEYAENAGRPVEGFVITDIGPRHHRCKYVRFKAGKLTDHAWTSPAERKAKTA